MILSISKVLLLLLIAFALIVSPANQACADQIEAGHHPPEKMDNQESSSHSDKTEPLDPQKEDTLSFLHPTTAVDSDCANTNSEIQAPQNLVTGSDNKSDITSAAFEFNDSPGQDLMQIEVKDNADHPLQFGAPEFEADEVKQLSAPASYAVDLQHSTSVYADALPAPFDGMQLIDDYWLIETLCHLNAVRDFLNYQYRLTNDIDIPAGTNWVPIGTSSSNAFRGVFDGANFTISSLNISKTSDYTGLFGYIDGATIQNLNLEVDNVTGGNYTGGLVGYATNSQLENCAVKVSTLPEKQISGVMYVGGLVGDADNTSILNCRASGYIKGTDNYVGGLVGNSSKKSIIKSSSSGVVSSLNNFVGGLVGNMTGTSVIESFSDSNVTGVNGVGGLIGYIQPGSGKVYNSYAIGSVTGNEYVGGLVGGVGKDNTIINCHTVSPVIGKLNSTIVGGFIGFSHSGSAANSNFNFWNTETSNMNTSAIGIGLNIDEMRLESSFVGLDSTQGFNFVTTWQMDESLGYPILQWQITSQPSDPDDPEEPDDPGDNPGDIGSTPPSHPQFLSGDITTTSLFQTGTLNNSIYYQLLNMLSRLEEITAALINDLNEPPAAVVEEITVLLVEIIELFNANRHLLGSAQQEFIISRLELLLSAFRV